MPAWRSASMISSDTRRLRSVSAASAAMRGSRSAIRPVRVEPGAQLAATSSSGRAALAAVLIARPPPSARDPGDRLARLLDIGRRFLQALALGADEGDVADAEQAQIGAQQRLLEIGGAGRRRAIVAAAREDDEHLLVPDQALILAL